MIDDNGDIKCEYKKADGTVVTGDYDVVPITIPLSKNIRIFLSWKKGYSGNDRL